MERTQFNISIDAPKEKVWNVLWQDDTYREWTSVFSPGSRAISDWEKGSKIKFLGEKESGMVAIIEDKVPNEYMAFKHMGEIKDGKEDTESERVTAWQGAMETYTLKGGSPTELKVEIDLNEEYKEMFMGMFPKALQKVKEISER